MKPTTHLLLVVPILLSGCRARGGGDAEPTIEPLSPEVGVFNVDSVLVEMSDAASPEVTLEIDGEFPDTCTEVHEVRQERGAFSVAITITTIRRQEASCAQAITPHHETIRLGSFEQTGTYALQVNGLSASFVIGAGGVGSADPYGAPVSAELRTPDGALSLLGPLGWFVEAGPGFLRIAATEGALFDTGTPSAARLTFFVATGPSRAQESALDGHSLREIYVYFALFPESRVGPPSEVTDLAWRGLEGHSNDSQSGDRHLVVLAIDEETSVAIQAYCPQGDWERFEPILHAMLESLEVH